MSKENWKIWLVLLGLWGLYACWYAGFQSGYGTGYGDGFNSAWSSNSPAFRQITNAEAVPDPDEFSDTAVR